MSGLEKQQLKWRDRGMMQVRSCYVLGEISLCMTQKESSKLLEII